MDIFGSETVSMTLDFLTTHEFTFDVVLRLANKTLITQAPFDLGIAIVNQSMKYNQ